MQEIISHAWGKSMHQQYTSYPVRTAKEEKAEEEKKLLAAEK